MFFLSIPSVMSLMGAAMASHPGKCESRNYMNWPLIRSKSGWG